MKIYQSGRLDLNREEKSKKRWISRGCIDNIQQQLSLSILNPNIIDQHQYEFFIEYHEIIIIHFTRFYQDFSQPEKVSIRTCHRLVTCVGGVRKGIRKKGVLRGGRVQVSCGCFPWNERTFINFVVY